MADFGGHKSTKAGQNLQAKLFSTKQPLVYSCIKVGDGQLGSKVIADLTAMIHTRLTMEITATPTRNQDGRWNITGVLSNRELTEPLKFREWGIFACDPDTNADVLVAYANAGESADIINPWDGSTISTLIEEEITCACLVTGDLQVDAIIIDPTQLYVPHDVFDAHNHDGRYYSKEEVTTLVGEKIIVIPKGKDIPITERKPGSWYLKITDIGSGGGANVRVSPNMRIKEVPLTSGL